MYSSYLSKDFDVLSIGVSGEKLSELKITHYLQIKKENKHYEKFSNKLLSPNNYIDEYLKSPEKFRQDYNSLLDFANELNTKLHLEKITENKRCILISSVLIALEDKAFKKSYKLQDSPQGLAKNLVNTVLTELKDSGVDNEKLDNIETELKFIHSDSSLSQKENVLQAIIDDIESNIQSFIKNHKYFDVLGKLYIAFLQYANSDKGLGIVLTPPHITELFCDLAKVNKNSVIYDNCTGTGGFLISAMKKMIVDSKGDQRKIKEIKNSQLYGTEYQSHVYSLAVTNMSIHQDGKTTIFKNDCFDQKLIKKVQLLKPNIGFLNPPYKSDKKKDIDELKFVMNNLECLIDGGKSISIVPMSCAISTQGKGVNLKKDLLKNNTLEAVLSMPSDLFSDSDVGTVTCIMIFTAKKPHPKNKKTFFGYFKDDGFEKKRRGRIDSFDKWKSIKEEWLYLYENAENKKGLSINQIVSGNDEWCPEAYLKTDFKQLKKENFIKNLKEYAIYLFNHKIKNAIYDKPNSKNNIELDFKKFSSFKIGDIFDVYSGGDKKINDDTDSNAELVNSIENQTTNNGIKEKIYFDNNEKILENFISVVSIGEGGKAFYQPEKGVCFTRVKGLVPKKEYKIKFNQFVFLYFCTILDLERYRYSYGRVLSKDRLRDTIIELPAKNGEIDFEFIEKFIKNLDYSSSI